ncbi:MAG: hypothetical protein OXC40_00690 [Proteobacteria bacterium]|nr:hypothetical protein [Pseudomonadota bacterium]
MLSHLHLSPKKLSNWQWSKPPLLPFLCFVLTGLLLLFLGLQPVSWWHSTKNTQPKQHHLWLVDLSPSVSGFITAADYQKLLMKEASTLAQNTTVDLITSQYLGPYRSFQGPNLPDLDLSFHKAGVLGASFLATAEYQQKFYSHIKVFSDFDAESWPPELMTQLSNRLRSSIQLVWLSQDHSEKKHLSTQQKRLSNVFVKHVDTPLAAHKSQFTVILERSTPHYLAEPPPFSLSGELRWQELSISPTYSPKTVSFYFPENVTTLAVPITLDFVDNETDTKAREGDPHANKHYLITLDLADAISLDNTYFGTHKQPQKVLMISPTLGEGSLTDPLAAHIVSLQILGYQVTRWDELPTQKGTSPIDYGHDYVMIYLPKFLTPFASNSGDRVGQNLASSVCDNMPKTQTLFLLPLTNLDSPTILCDCLTKFTQTATHPLSCSKDISDIDSLREFFDRHDFRGLGGDLLVPKSQPFYLKALNMDDGKPAYLFISLTALNPFGSRSSNTINHARLPFFFQSILQLTIPTVAPKDRISPSSSALKNLEIIARFLEEGYLANNSSALLSPSQAIRDITRVMQQLGLTEWPHNKIGDPNAVTNQLTRFDRQNVPPSESVITLNQGLSQLSLSPTQTPATGANKKSTSMITVAKNQHLPHGITETTAILLLLIFMLVLALCLIEIGYDIRQIMTTANHVPKDPR